MAYAAIVPYADKTYCSAYMAERLNPDAWTDNVASQDAALAQATRAIDELPLVGTKQESDQVREFPRSVDTDTDIPVEVQNACCELALSLLQGNLTEELMHGVGVASEGVGDTAVSYTGERGAAALLDDQAGLPSREAYSMLAPWIVDQSTIDLIRT